MTVRVSVLVVSMMVSAVSSASAQGGYVSAAVMADIVRSTHSDYGGVSDEGGGEVLGFALRAGTPLGAIWGVEIEFARPGEIERELATGVPIPLDIPVTVPGVPSIVRNPEGARLAEMLIRGGYPLRMRTAERHSTLSAALWVQQQFTGRFSMVYLGGVAFSRSVFESEVTYSPLILVPESSSLVLPPTLSETTVYGIRPVVGVESRLQMTARAQLVPGLRMQAANGQWFIRPSLGLSWNF